MKRRNSILCTWHLLRPTWDSVRDSSPASSITTLFRVDLSRTGRPVGQPHLAMRALRRNRFSGALSRLNVAPFNFTRGRTFATSIQLSRPSGRSIKGKLVCPTSQWNLMFTFVVYRSCFCVGPKEQNTSIYKRQHKIIVNQKTITINYNLYKL